MMDVRAAPPLRHRLSMNPNWLCKLTLGVAFLAQAGCSSVDSRADESVDVAAALTAPAPGCAAAANRQNHYYEFQDDTCKRKVWPSAPDRAWHCPNAFSNIPAGYEPHRPLAEVLVDESALADIPKEIELTLVVIRRDGSGKPHYRYYSNGTDNVAVQPLSSTKFMAVASAAATIRKKSGGAVGLSATVGGVPLGDLVTVIHNYNEEHYESNALARYFLDIGGRDAANDLIHGWLARSSHESFGGNYGAPVAPLGRTLVGPDGKTLEVSLDDQASHPNNLSTLTMAEFLKRIVMHREDAESRLPGIQWKDIETILYGAEREAWFPLASESGVSHPRGWGGMTADAAIYLQSAVDIHDRERRARGRWRIFSKLGYGQSGFVENSYGCFPELDGNGAPIADAGVELVLSTHYAQTTDSPVASSERDARIEGYYRLIVGRVTSGRL